MNDGSDADDPWARWCLLRDAERKRVIGDLCNSALDVPSHHLGGRTRLLEVFVLTNPKALLKLKRQRQVEKNDARGAIPLKLVNTVVHAVTSRLQGPRALHGDSHALAPVMGDDIGFIERCMEASTPNGRSRKELRLMIASLILSFWACEKGALDHFGHYVEPARHLGSNAHHAMNELELSAFHTGVDVLLDLLRVAQPFGASKVFVDELDVLRDSARGMNPVAGVADSLKKLLEATRKLRRRVALVLGHRIGLAKNAAPFVAALFTTQLACSLRLVSLL
jgi:hypothetical protein